MAEYGSLSETETKESIIKNSRDRRSTDSMKKVLLATILTKSIYKLSTRQVIAQKRKMSKIWLATNSKTSCLNSREEAKLTVNMTWLKSRCTRGIYSRFFTSKPAQTPSLCKICTEGWVTTCQTLRRNTPTWNTLMSNRWLIWPLLALSSALDKSYSLTRLWPHSSATLL